MDNFMNENIRLAIGGIGLGLLVATIWYAEMFTDSKAANLWRRMNGREESAEIMPQSEHPHLHAFFF